MNHARDTFHTKWLVDAFIFGANDVAFLLFAFYMKVYNTRQAQQFLKIYEKCPLKL